MSLLLRRRLPITLGTGVEVVTYLLRDEFTTAESAPLASPRTAEPGPGTLTIRDTGNTWDISGGAIIANAAATGAGNPRIVSVSSFARATGLTMFVSWQRRSDLGGSGAQNPGVGFVDRAGPLLFDHVAAGFLGDNTETVISELSTRVFSVGIPGNNSIIDGVIVLRSAGAWVFTVTGGVYTLRWVLNTNTTATLYASVYSQGAYFPNHTYYMRVRQLEAPWQDDYGIATDRKAGSVSAGTTFGHEVDCLIEFVVTTVPSAGSIKVFFRIQDASNYWEIDIDSTGALTLNEVVAGSPTSRGSAAGVVANGDRIVIVADDTTIRVWDTGASNVIRRIAYGSASNFQTEVDGELDALGTGGVVNDIATWPRTISGSAKTELERI